jgi:TRAP-type transport system periplasmic protein
MRPALVAAIAACLLVSSHPSAFSQDLLKLRIGHITSLTSLTGQGTTELAATAKALSDGAINVEIFPNAQLGGETEMLSQVSLGDLDMAMTGSGIIAAIEPAFSVTEMPYIWKGADDAWTVLNGPIGDKLLARLDAKGMKGLGWGVWGFRGVLTNGFPVEKPSDLKGRKIRVVENPLYVKTIRTFGGNPVPMSWPAVYSALQQHTIDGVDTNYFGMADGALQEVAKNLAVTNHIFTATVFVMNRAKWQSLTPAQQAILSKSVHAGGEVMRDGAAKANADAITLMERSGVKLTHPDPAVFESAIGPVYDEFSKIIGPDLIAEVKAAQH